MEEEFDQALKVLREFITSMRIWQLEAAKHGKKLFGDAQAIAAMTNKLYEIYVRFMIDPKPVEGLTWSTKPSYDPKTENVVEVKRSGKKVVVVTDRLSDVPQRRIRYTLVETPDGYKLKNSIQRYDEFEKKFVKWDFML